MVAQFASLGLIYAYRTILQPQGGTRGPREMAHPLQHKTSTLVTRIQTSSTPRRQRDETPKKANRSRPGFINRYPAPKPSSAIKIPPEFTLVRAFGHLSRKFHRSILATEVVRRQVLEYFDDGLAPYGQ